MHIFRRISFLLLVLGSVTTTALAQPVAAFSADVTTGCPALIVNFTDLSSGSPTSWFWDFGNGNTSTFQNPSAVYSASGSYTVTLIVTGPGGSDTLVMPGYISVAVPPSVTFSSANNTGCGPLTVNFTGTATPGTGSISTWFWDFGDGSTSALQNPSHTYTVQGIYSVTLIVTNTAGCSKSVTVTNHVRVSDGPAVAFTADTTVACDGPFPVVFTSTTSGVAPLVHTWAFGDGGSGSGAVAAHNYTIGGNFSVQLHVMDAYNCADSLLLPAYIQLGVPTVNFMAADTVVCPGDSFAFTDMSAASCTSWDWDFGDGNSSTLQHPLHAYSAPGVYTVSLAAFNSAGCGDTLTRTAYLTVSNLPGVDFSASSVYSCEYPFITTFTDLTTGTFPAVSWLWDFGDGVTSTLANPSHTYTAPGVYTVELTVTDANGCVSDMIKNGYITIADPTVSFTAIPVVGCVPVNVGFSGSSASVEPVTTWSWDFGDGVGTSALQNPAYTYTTAGVYTVTLSVMNSAGCRDTLSVPAFISAGNSITADFSATPLLVCYGDPVSFTDLSTGAPADTWTWNFGDGNVSPLANPSHVFADTGCFDITFTVWNLGCSSTLTRTSYVCVNGPRADFTIDSPFSCTAPHTVNFNHLYDVTATSWAWDFGDGSGTSALADPSYTYTAPGMYPVVLTAFNSGTGCSDEYRDTVIVSGLNAAFSASTVTPCANNPVGFTDLSTITVPIASWLWTFGDGDSAFVQNPSHTYGANGSYTVTLTITDTLGCTDTQTIPAYINANGPVADFTADTTRGCPGLNVTFTDASSGTAALSAWNWNFGDASSGSGTPVSHIYAGPGSYSVQLVVTDINMCTDTLVFTGFIHTSQPAASFTPTPVITCPGNPAAFTNTSAGDSLTYSWDFGDGSPLSSLTHPSHTYASSGSFTVTLTAIDSNYCTDVFTAPATVQFPLSNFGAPDTAANCPPFLCSFSDSSSADVTAWLWNFGDGGTSTLENPLHVYSTAGSFTVQLIVTSVSGCSDTLVRTAYINIEGPTGSFTLTPDSGCVPHDVEFAATSPGTISYIWDFGDGSVTAGTDSILYTYLTSGVFYPTLIIEDSSGCQVTLPSPGGVNVQPGPLAAIAASDTLLCNPDSVFFTDNTVSALPLISWMWNFGDPASGTADTSSLQNPSHDYIAFGYYPVSVNVTDLFGCTDTASLLIHVAPAPLASGFTDTSVICQYQSLAFTDSSSAASGLAAWWWDFGDGNTDSVQHPVHIYDSAGTFTIILTVTDSAGCTENDTITVDVVAAPVADFISPDTASCFPEAASFTNTSSGASSWMWIFGDSTTDITVNPNHAFPSAGSWDVTLIVTNAAGCSDTLIRTNYITQINLIPGFYAADTAGCVPFSTLFTDTTVSDTGITFWNWNFGDGSTGSGSSVSHTYTIGGSFDVTLIVGNLAGCEDTAVYPLYINLIPPVPPQLCSASVTDDNSVQVTTHAFTGGEFAKYILWMETFPGSGIYTRTDSSTNAADTVFNVPGITPSNFSTCFKIQIQDTCGRYSDTSLSQEHCTTELLATPGTDMVTLTWSAYTGWAAVDSYAVYRVTDYNPATAVRITTVDGSTLLWTDMNTPCGTPVSYRILATESGGTCSAWSDTASATPLHDISTLPPGMVRATVTGDTDVLVDWQPVSIPRAASVLVDRSDDGVAWMPFTSLPPSAVSYTDTSADPHTQSWWYRIAAEDSCGDRTAFSEVGRSIFLTLEHLTGVVNLTWNPYQNWSGGVQEYTIEARRQSSATWNTVGTSVSTTYTDNTTDITAESWCYRIRATENGGNNAVSISNEACTTPEIWASNTITPNGDNSNDFLVIPALENYPDNQLTILNRWGNVVYETDGYRNDWSGMNKNGEPVPDGTYFFVLKLNGYGVEIRNYVTVLR